MRLFESVLLRWKITKQPQQKFLCHVMRLLLLLPGHVTFRHLSRYSAYHEKTFARWFARDFDVVSLNHAAIVETVAPSHEHVLAFDPSFVSKSGQRTYGLDMFWNGAHSRAAKGLEIATLAWVDVTYNSAYALSVEQTPPAQSSDAEQTRIDTYLSQIAGVVTTQPLQPLKYLVVDGYCSQQKFVDGICAWDMHLGGKLRRDANLRHLYRGPRHNGPGRPKTSDGKVSFSDFARFEHVESGDEAIPLYHQVVHHGHLKRHLRLVLGRHRPPGRDPLLLSTDVTLLAQTIYRYSKARFQIEFLFRDAKQFTGLRDGQARSANTLRFHFNASLSAVSFAKLEARQISDKRGVPFSMASLKRRWFNQHLLDRILAQFATEGSVEKSSPVYEELCNDGTMHNMVA